MRLILNTDLSRPVHSLRYTEENASETLNKKVYNHYKFSFMLLKNFFRKMCIFRASISYAKQNQNTKEAHITLSLTPRYNHSCPWLPLARGGPHRFTEIGQIFHKEKTFQVTKLHPR